MSALKIRTIKSYAWFLSADEEYSNRESKVNTRPQNKLNSRFYYQVVVLDVLLNFKANWWNHLSKATYKVGYYLLLQLSDPYCCKILFSVAYGFDTLELFGLKFLCQLSNFSLGLVDLNRLLPFVRLCFNLFFFFLRGHIKLFAVLTSETGDWKFWF